MSEGILIWYCEDDEEMWDVQKEELEEAFPGIRVKHFLNAGYCMKAGGSPDFIVIDVGAAMIGCDMIAVQRANLEGLADLHPGTMFIVTSAIGEYARELYLQLSKDLQAVCRWADACWMDQSLCNVIEECI